MFRTTAAILVSLVVAVSAAISANAASSPPGGVATLASGPAPTAIPSPGLPPLAPMMEGDFLADWTLHWIDNSDNEEGFEIEAKVHCSGALIGPYRYTVAPNTTSLPMPPDLPPGMGRQSGWGFCNEAQFNVTAFNAFGRSTTVGVGIFADPPLDGDPPLRANGGPAAAMPLLFAGFLLVTSGGILRIIARSRSIDGSAETMTEDHTWPS